MILIMIDGSEKHPIVKAVFQLQSLGVFLKSAVISEFPKKLYGEKKQQS